MKSFSFWLVLFLVLATIPVQAARSTVKDFNAAYTASQAALTRNDRLAAINHAEEAFRIHKELFGPQTRDGAALSLSLTRLYGATERWTNAARAAEEGVSIVEAVGGENDPALVPLLYALGRSNIELDQNDKADEALQRSLTIVKDDASIPAALGGDINYALGRIDREREDVWDLRKHAKAARQAYEEAYGPESYEVGSALFQLGMAAQLDKNNREALKHYQAAMVIFEATRPPNDPLFESLRSHMVGLASFLDKPELSQQYADQLNASNPNRNKATPILRVPPRYPVRAQSKGKEGWVMLEFTITKTGNVEDIKVVDSDPIDVFDKSAMTAVKKWKYAAKKVDGVAVDQYGMQQIITYKISR